MIVGKAKYLDMTQKQIEELQRLCDSCGDKYVRVEYDFDETKMFLKNPRIIKSTHSKKLAIESFDAIEILSVKLDSGYVKHSLVWKNKKIVFLYEGTRIYKTPFSTKAVKRIVDNMFNNKLK